MLRRRWPLAASAAALTLAALAPATTAQAEPIVTPELIDQEQFCLELIPRVLSTERAAPVRLDLRILLDGPSRATAAAAVQAMRTAYDPLGVEIRPSYRKVSFEGTQARGLIEQAKKSVGGKPPAGIDAVYVLTDKDIVGPPPAGTDVAGLADCVGGVLYPAHAFAVGEVFPEKAPQKFLPGTIDDATGKTMAHEIGHLLGAHHHYASPEGLSAVGQQALTLMGPSISLINLRFSSLNASIARGHLELRARR
ncbi:MAG: zinc-dependent metalloprotease family protein [Sporichthyaceae bacterium]